MIPICIECASVMEEVSTDEFQCPDCGFGAEQLSLPADLDPEIGPVLLKNNGT
jgi:tRNA(Ile2) C34 agmatinyltransferase TiaS